MPHCAGWYVVPFTVTGKGLRLYGVLTPDAFGRIRTPARISAVGVPRSKLTTFGKAAAFIVEEGIRFAAPEISGASVRRRRPPKRLRCVAGRGVACAVGESV